MKTGILVKDAMTKKPIYISPETSIKECSELMLKEKVGSMLVMQDNVLTGIISEKDIVERVVAQSKDPAATRAQEIMSKKLTTISPGEDLFDALQLMKIEKIRKLPVVDGQKFLGLLTANDVLRLQPALLELYVERLHVREHEDKLSRFDIENL